MKRNIFYVTVNFMLFWIVTDLFSGIEVFEGIVGYVICGGLFGGSMLIVEPLIRFLTLPVKFVTVFFASVMISIMIFTFLNFGVSLIDFKEGVLIGFSNNYFQFPQIELDMIGSILAGGTAAGVLSSVLRIFADS